MVVINRIFKDIEEFKKFKFPASSQNNILIQVFTGYYQHQELEIIYNILKSQNIHFIGTTTAGEIFEGRYSIKSIVVSISIFEKSSVAISHFAKDDDCKTGRVVAKTMVTDLTKILILFSEGLRTNGDDLVQGIASVNPNIVIAGGMAGDYGDMKKTFVFDHNGIYDRGVVVASINSEVLQVFTDYQLNWQPIGKVMTVTKANKNILYEIDNMNVKDLYRKYLGEKIADLFPISAIEFPLVKIGDQGMLLGRDILMALDDGGFITAGNLEVGDKVRFSFGNVDLIVNQTKENLEKYKSLRPEALYIYSCVSRRWFLQDDINIELTPLNDIADNSGFFTYGEIFHQNSRNMLLNVTMTLVGLSEKGFENRKVTHSSRKKNLDTTKRFLVLEALTHLSNEVIRELEESKKQIEETHNLIQDSIEYASIIQQAILPIESKLLKKFFSNYFLFWQPRDIVGGDIYFIERISKDEVVVILIDCTGHGIPGAFLTMLMKAIEKQIIIDILHKQISPSPSAILKCFNQQLHSYTRNQLTNQIGFDGGVLYFNKEKNIVKYAGIKTPLFCFKKASNILEVFQDSRYIRIGNNHTNGISYDETIVHVQQGDMLYLTTDGFLEQNGGKKDIPFGKRRFRHMVEKYSSLPLDKQKEKFIEEFEDWKRGFQTDDITLIGLQI